jgi:2-aminoadipate transaminase
VPADAAELLVRAEAAGVTFVKGADFFSDGSGSRAARLAFSYASPSEIGDGVSILASLLRA